MHVLPPVVVFFIVIVRPIICEDLPGQLYKNLKIRFYDANNMIPVYGLPIKIQQRQSTRDQNFNSGFENIYTKTRISTSTINKLMPEGSLVSDLTDPAPQAGPRFVKRLESERMFPQFDDSMDDYDQKKSVRVGNNRQLETSAAISPSGVTGSHPSKSRRGDVSVSQLAELLHSLKSMGGEDGGLPPLQSLRFG